VKLEVNDKIQIRGPNPKMEIYLDSTLPGTISYAGGMWNHDHSDTANVFTESNFIGPLSAQTLLPVVQVVRLLDCRMVQRDIVELSKSSALINMELEIVILILKNFPKTKNKPRTQNSNPIELK